MKVLGYSQIMHLLKRGSVFIDGITYIVPEYIKKHISDNMPVSGSFICGKAILVAIPNSEVRKGDGGEIVMFLPNGPPDPG